MSKNQVKTGKNNRPKMLDESKIGAGVFSNIINLSMTSREVFIDFGVSIPDPSTGDAKINLASRIILTKEHALEFQQVLNDSLKVYAE